MSNERLGGRWRLPRSSSSSSFLSLSFTFPLFCPLSSILGKVPKKRGGGGGISDENQKLLQISLYIEDIFVPKHADFSENSSVFVASGFPKHRSCHHHYCQHDVVWNFKVFWIFDDHSRLRKEGNQCNFCNCEIISQMSLPKIAKLSSWPLFARAVISPSHSFDLQPLYKSICKHVGVPKYQVCWRKYKIYTIRSTRYVYSMV